MAGLMERQSREPDLKDHAHRPSKRANVLLKRVCAMGSKRPRTLVTRPMSMLRN